MSESDPAVLREAVAFCVAAMINADGRADPAELDHARAALARCLLFADTDTAEDRTLLARMTDALETDPEGNAQRYGAVLHGSPWRYTALAIMADIMASDGRMEESEFAVLRRAAAILDATDHELEAIVENVNTDELEDLITGQDHSSIEGLLALRYADPPAD